MSGERLLRDIDEFTADTRTSLLTYFRPLHRADNNINIEPMGTF